MNVQSGFPNNVIHLFPITTPESSNTDRITATIVSIKIKRNVILTILPKSLRLMYLYGNKKTQIHREELNIAFTAPGAVE